MARNRTLSRGDRWRAAVAEARSILDAIMDQKQALEGALSDLNDIKAEYEEWLDNLPEGLRDGPTGSKLQEVADIDFEIEIDTDEVKNVIDTAEQVDLPLGWGRD